MRGKYIRQVHRHVQRRNVREGERENDNKEFKPHSISKQKILDNLFPGDFLSDLVRRILDIFSEDVTSSSRWRTDSFPEQSAEKNIELQFKWPSSVKNFFVIALTLKSGRILMHDFSHYKSLYLYKEAMTTLVNLN